MLASPCRIAGAVSVLAAVLLIAPEGRPATRPIERVGREDGPMPDVVTALCLDRSGLLWIGSRDGLKLFDGETVREFDHDATDPASISDDAIRVIYEDREGRLWIGTNSGGLNRLDRASWRFDRFRNDPADPASLSHDSVYAIREDRAGRLWVGTQRGLNRLDPSTRKVTRFVARPGDPGALASDYILALHEDRAGRLWVATLGGGLSRVDPETGAITTFHHDDADPGSLRDDWVTALFEDPSGFLWIGTDVGVNRLDPNDGSMRRVPLDGAAANAAGLVVMAFAAGRPGLVWVGTQAGGLLELNTASATLRRGPANDARWPDPGAPVQALLSGADGSLWIGTWGGGLRRLSPMALFLAEGRRGSAIPAALEGADITAINSDHRGGAWFGTADGAVRRIGPAVDSTRHDAVIAPGPVAVLALAEDPGGRLWYGTNTDLVRLDPATGTSIKFSHDPGDPASPGPGYVRVVMFDHLGRLWIGTGEGGVERLDERGRVVERHVRDPADPASLSDNYVTALHEAADGLLWVGTRSGGLDILDPRTGRAARFVPDPADPGSFPHHCVTAIHADRLGRTWVATAGAGLVLARPHQDGRLRFDRFTEKDGLVDDDVVAILEDDDGSLWLPTRRGLARFDPAGRRFVAVHATDGLPSAEFEIGSAVRSGDRLYFGTIKGPVALRAGTVFPEPSPSPTVVTAIRTPAGDVRGARPVWDLDHLSIPYGQWLSMDLAVLDYAPGPRHRYAYRLGGDWIDLGPTRQITLTQLRPGTHRFSARGRNAAGVWGEPTTELAIDVVPPFWMTGWFRGTALLGLAVAVAFAHRARVAAVERRNRELLALHEQREHARRDLGAAYERLSLLARRLEASKEEERQRIARELHDDMGPSLTAVIINLQLLSRAAAAGTMARIQDTIHMVDRLVQRVRDLSLDLRPPLLDELGLADALRGYMEAQAARAGLPIAVEAGPGLEGLPRAVEVHAFRVAQEAVTNAIRHAAATQVVVSIGRRDGDIVLSVRDDGRGFDADAVMRSPASRTVGLMGMHERVRTLGGSLAIESAPGRGTEVKARIPVVEAA